MNNYKKLKYNLDNQIRIYGKNFYDISDNSVVIYNNNYSNTYDIIKHFVESGISKFYIVNHNTNRIAVYPSQSGYPATTV